MLNFSDEFRRQTRSYPDRCASRQETCRSLAAQFEGTPIDLGRRAADLADGEVLTFDGFARRGTKRVVGGSSRSCLDRGGAVAWRIRPQRDASHRRVQIVN